MIAIIVAQSTFLFHSTSLAITSSNVTFNAFASAGFQRPAEGVSPAP
jgi:hypothetical protein